MQRKKTLQLLADYLKLSSFKELVAEDNSMIEREEEREDVISNVTEHMEGLDPKIVNMLVGVFRTVVSYR